jgi:hypothetical protein
VPERGLYTGTLIVGAIGSGKTSACMYPYVEQLLAYRASEPARKVAGLVLEVKGDFCRQVREILRRHGRGDDYVEVSLESRYRYNPLHNDLDAYALAYGIATLMTNLFGHGKEPFWQQASTNLVKFVILLHQTLDDYVTGSTSGAPSIVVTIGLQTRVFHAFVTSAPPCLDAPTTVTLYAATLADVAGFAADELPVEPAMARLPARLVLVDAMELTWQRARCREGSHRLLPADPGLVGLTTLQRWLWRRLQTSSVSEDTCDESSATNA